VGSFIVSNELEDKLIRFIKIVAENEPVEEYRNRQKYNQIFTILILVEKNLIL